MTKIILSHAYFIVEDLKEQQIMKPYPPLGLLSVSAWLEQAHFQHEVLDSTFMTVSAWKGKVRSQEPDILAMYTNLITKPKLIELMQWVHTILPETKIILGGPDVTYNIENYLGAGADFLVIGEGEQTLLELIESMTSQGDFSEIKGIALKNGEGRVVRTAARPHLRDLDLLPLPNRKKIDLDLYLAAWTKTHGKSSISLSTQRGCPYTCKWCSTAVYGQSYRRRSPQSVVDEIKHLLEKYGPDQFWFVDDVFTISHKWLQAFRDQLKATGVRISFECISRADRLNEDILDVLSDMGCFRIWIGAESGSQRILDAMDRRVEAGQVKKMIKGAKDRGIQAGTFIMLGYPGETEEDIKETVEYLKASDPDHFTITLAYPIKGTDLYAQVASVLNNREDWTKTTDRDRDFPRTYTRKYYDYAVRWVHNSVHLNKRKRKGGILGWRLLPIAVKVWLSRAGMYWSRAMSIKW